MSFPILGVSSHTAKEQELGLAPRVHVPKVIYQIKNTIEMGEAGMEGDSTECAEPLRLKTRRVGMPELGTLEATLSLSTRTCP